MGRQLLLLVRTEEKRLAQEQATESARQKSIEKELEWVRQNPKGRQAKSKARMARFEELNSSEYQKRSKLTDSSFPPVHVWVIKLLKCRILPNLMATAL